MRAVQATIRNGRLELMHPVDWPDGTRAEVIPLLNTEPSSADTGVSPATWPPGYFEQTAGALTGEEFERPPQGNLPLREDW